MNAEKIKILLGWRKLKDLFSQALIPPVTAQSHFGGRGESRRK